MVPVPPDAEALAEPLLLPQTAGSVVADNWTGAGCETVVEVRVVQPLASVTVTE
jgi:hypothetical protein